MAFDRAAGLLLLTLGLAGAAGGPPSEIDCQDPNFVVGGSLLGGYITPNELSTDILFAASATQYEYNSPVHFTVTAPKGSKLYNEKHIYLAVQIDWTGANGEAQGHFHDLSPGARLPAPG